MEGAKLRNGALLADGTVSDNRRAWTWLQGSKAGA